MKKILQEVFNGRSLTEAESERAMDLMLQGGANNEQAAALLGALQAKKESVEEITGFVKSILKTSTLVKLQSADAMDVCGTGGDQSGTFNISTAVALLLASCGIPVAKHGNRSVSSQSGSTDVLEALKIPIDQDPAACVRQLDTLGFGFFFAPRYHPVLAKIGEVRRNLGVRTSFNLLGPLLNPGRVKRQLLGIYDSGRLDLMANVLKALGTEEAFVVASEDGLDEFSLSAPTKVVHLKNGKISAMTLTPEAFGLAYKNREELKGGDARFNAGIIQDIFAGKPGACREVVLMNTAAALFISGKVTGFKEGVGLAAQAIDSGKTRDLLEKIRLSHQNGAVK